MVFELYFNDKNLKINIYIAYNDLISNQKARKKKEKRNLHQSQRSWS